jgi:hypothetical protein
MAFKLSMKHGGIAMSDADQLEREVARQLEIANEFARSKAKVEERTAARQARVLLEKQAKEHVKAMLNKPVVKHQTQLPTQPEVQQTKLQTPQPQLEQPVQLAKQFDEVFAKANELLVSLGGTPIVKADAQPDTPEQTPEQPQLSEEEQYQTTITQSMIALIKQRKKR